MTMSKTYVVHNVPGTNMGVAVAADASPVEIAAAIANVAAFMAECEIPGVTAVTGEERDGEDEPTGDTGYVGGDEEWVDTDEDGECLCEWCAR
jgi:hypothetical protein